MTAMQQEVTLLPLHCNKICKTILTHSAIHDTLYRKSHRACRGNAPPSCLRKTALPLKSPTGAFIATQTRSCRKVQNGEDLFPMKIFTAPQHTRSILPLFHPTKFFACLAGRYFSFGKLHLEFFISRLNEILRHDLTLSVGEPDNAAAKQGQELRSV